MNHLLQDQGMMLHRELSAPGREGREQELTADPSVSTGMMHTHRSPKPRGCTAGLEFPPRLPDVMANSIFGCCLGFPDISAEVREGRTVAGASSHASSPLTGDVELPLGQSC